MLSLEAMMISVILSICGFVTSMTTSAVLKLELRQTLLFYQSSLSFVKSESEASRCVTSGNVLAQKCHTSSSSVSFLGLKRLDDLSIVIVFVKKTRTLRQTNILSIFLDFFQKIQLTSKRKSRSLVL